MLTTLLDFFCSRDFAEPPKMRMRLLLLIQALAWFAIATVIGWVLAGAFALPGENVEALAVLSGASPAEGSAFPLLQWVLGLTLGATPSMAALNGFGAVVMGGLAALTWSIVFFWVQDAMNDDSISPFATWVSMAVAHLACVCLLLSLPGLYALSAFTLNSWCFLWLLGCAALQNLYAQEHGRRWAMILFSLVLGIGAVESPWVLLFLPIFFLRALAIEWRLWDHSVKNLSLWFISLVVGVAGLLIANALRMNDELSLAAIVSTELSVLRVHLAFLSGLLLGHPWIFLLAGGVAWPVLGWITGRQLLNNARSWGLLFTASVLTLAGFAFFAGSGGRIPLPVSYWLAVGQIPLATAWVTAVAFAMLLAGWGVQLFARNPNLYEEHDRNQAEASVSAMRVGAIFLFPASIIIAAVLMGIQLRRFNDVDRDMMQRFAGETIRNLAAESNSPAAAHPYLLSAPWIDLHLLLEAQQSQVPLTLFSLDRAQDAPYLAKLRHHLETDPLLGDADRLRLVHLLDYNFLTFVQDFFVSQPNAMRIAAAYDLADVWYAAKGRPYPFGTLYLGLPENSLPTHDPYPEQQALQDRWAKTLAAENLPWWDLNAKSQRAIRHHLAFMANNLGTFLDDLGRLPEAAACYYYAHKTDRENVSALLNIYDLSVRRGQLPDKRIEINRAFQDFITARAKASRKYDLSAVGRYYGYIRNYDLFVQMGWEWAVSSAPESVLAGLRNAQSSLSPTDPRGASMIAVLAAVYELQGQHARSVETYRAAVEANPQNIEAMRGLARLAIQAGKVHEAGQWLAKAEEAGAEQEALDIDRTAYLMAIGDLEGASRAIGRYTTNHKDSAIGWAMLGMLEIEKGNPDRAAGFILQNIRRTAQGRDLYFQHVLEGRLAQHHAAEAETLSKDPVKLPNEVARHDAAKRARALWEDARRQYRRAYAIRPNVRGLLELILDFDRRLDDKNAAEADALAILREDTRHPYANFIVGSQRLLDGEVEAALKYFRLAVEGSEGTANLDLINNYAETLTRLGRHPLAKEMGLKGVQLAPTNYASWATYALTLARGGEAAKAKTALAKAHELAQNNKTPIDPRVSLVDIWIALEENEPQKAKQHLAELQTRLGDTLMPLDRRDLQELSERLGP